VYLAASTGIDCIGNFRQLDVYRGGQGAPLVPYGAELFHEYNVFLNFGGIVNIDCNGAGWDIGYCNMLSNYYANLTGIEYDKEGSLGRCGKFNQSVNYIMSSDQKLSSITTNKSFGR
jgi:anhydro-N-acetylmuramic acid kinase